MTIRPLAGLLLLALALAAPATAAEPPGRLTGGTAYTIPPWFKESFLELADDAAEAAVANKHVMLFMHLEACPYCEAMLRESIDGADYSPWLRERFDAIAINIRGDREVVFDAATRVSEKQLARLLKVSQTPAIIFLDGDNRAVLRLDGYRTPKEFKRILDFVDSRSYRTTDLASFVSSDAAGQQYALRPHPAFQQLHDLSRLDQPLMVLFEDAWCDGCNLLHDTLLADPEVNELLGKLVVVRLDARSPAPLVDPAGNRTTPRAWIEALGMQARPGIFLFDGARELVRIQGVLRHHHFVTALRYAAERKFAVYPTLREYSRVYRDGLLKAGVNVDLGRQ